MILFGINYILFNYRNIGCFTINVPSFSMCFYTLNTTKYVLCNPHRIIYNKRDTSVFRLFWFNTSFLHNNVHNMLNFRFVKKFEYTTAKLINFSLKKPILQNSHFIFSSKRNNLNLGITCICIQILGKYS